MQTKLVVQWVPGGGCAPDDGPEVAGCADIHLFVVAPVGATATLDSVTLAEQAGHQQEQIVEGFLTMVYEPGGAQPPSCAPAFGADEILIDLCAELWATDAYHNGLWAVQAQYSVEIDAMSSETGTTGIEVELKNLLLTMQHDDDHPPLLEWLGDGNPGSKTQIAFTLASENVIPVECEVRVYPVARTDATPPIRTYTVVHNSPTPGPVWADWDSRGQRQRHASPRHLRVRRVRRRQP